jgi:hypothetical protein
MGVGGQSQPRPIYPLEKNRYPLYRELGKPPGPDCLGAENLAPTGVRTPDRRDRSQSLYQLSYQNSYVLNNVGM